MRYSLTARHLELPTGFSKFVQHRLNYAMGRLAEQVEAIDVRLADLNGPKGGVDVEARAMVRFVHGGNLVLHERAVSVEGAVRGVFGRLRSALKRTHARDIQDRHR
jgi:putative sigma-54 modulation protein